jgi:hypothetical protein
VKTTKLSGDLDPKGAVDAIIKLAETPACATELEAAGSLPLNELKEEEGQLTGAIKKAHAEIYVGEDDHIIRKVAAELTVEPPKSGEKVEVELEFTLGKVNEKQAISAPASSEPLENLFGELGINPDEILSLMQGGGSEGLGSLLEGITGSSSSSSGSGESSSSLEEEIESLGGSSEAAQEFGECLEEAKSASDIQKCSSLME